MSTVLLVSFLAVQYAKISITVPMLREYASILDVYRLWQENAKHAQLARQSMLKAYVIKTVNLQLHQERQTIQ